MRKSAAITVLMILGLVAGALAGEYLRANTVEPIGPEHWTKFVGTLVVIRPLMLMIVPLVFVSVTLGVTSVGNPAKLGLLGGSTLVYYLTSMALAAVLGATLVSTVKPGVLPAEQQHQLTTGAEADYRTSDVAKTIKAAEDAEKTSVPGAWMDLVDQMIPTNIVREMSEGKTLGVIVFAIIFGLALAMGGEKTKPVVTVLEGLNEAILRMVGWVIWLAPIGVFLLVAWTVGRIGVRAVMGPLAGFMLVVIGALAVHSLVTLPVILAVFGRANPYKFMWQMRRALLTAFGTASSAATMPVTLECCVNEGKCSKRATNFVIPLGATVNMDGTALFEAVAVIFLCQLYGISLEYTEVLVIVVTATLAAIGAAGIPSAGLVTMVIVIHAVNTTLASSGKETLPASALGVVVGIDRLLDMCRTTVNVWGDMVGAKLVSRLAPDDELESTKHKTQNTNSEIVGS